MGTWILGIVIALACVYAIKKIIDGKKDGGCSGGCSGCGSADKGGCSHH